MIPVFIVFILFFFVFGIAGLALYFDYAHKMAKMKAQSKLAGGTDVDDVLDSIRREIAELRDTATRYDMSFDSALQRLEGRVGNLEQASRQLPAGSEARQTEASQSVTRGISHNG